MLAGRLEIFAHGLAQRARSRNQAIPTAPHRLLQTGSSREENVRLPGLDFLKRADVEVGQLGELFLGDSASSPLSTQVSPKGFELAGNDGRNRHALSCRKRCFDRTA